MREVKRTSRGPQISMRLHSMPLLVAALPACYLWATERPVSALCLYPLSLCLAPTLFTCTKQCGPLCFWMGCWTQNVRGQRRCGRSRHPRGQCECVGGESTASEKRKTKGKQKYRREMEGRKPMARLCKWRRVQSKLQSMSPHLLCPMVDDQTWDNTPQEGHIAKTWGQRIPSDLCHSSSSVKLLLKLILYVYIMIIMMLLYLYTCSILHGCWLNMGKRRLFQ